jgi:hypothetical protein
MKNINIMKNIDIFFFKQVDNVVQHPEFQKVSDFYSSLDEKAQELVKVALLILTVGLPLLVLFIFFSINQSKKVDLLTKDKLIQTANTLIQKKSLIKSEEMKTLSQKYVDSQRGLKAVIDSKLRLINIESTKVLINDFNTEDLDGLISKLSANLSFKGLTSDGLMALFNSLNAKLKVKIDEVSIRKNDITNSLDGVMSIHYYSKDNSEDEEE